MNDDDPSADQDVVLRVRIAKLRQEHQDLDAAVHALELSQRPDSDPDRQVEEEEADPARRYQTAGRPDDAGHHRLNPADTVLAWSLEAAFDAAWPALKVVPVGDWLCKSAPGVSRRANAANPAGAHARLTEAGIDRIEAIYAKLGQAAYVRLPSLLGDEPDRRLAARGYGAEGPDPDPDRPLAAADPSAEVELSPASLRRSGSPRSTVSTGARARPRSLSTPCWPRSTFRPPSARCGGRAGSYRPPTPRPATAGCAWRPWPRILDWRGRGAGGP